jgi:hypothetical protein
MNNNNNKNNNNYNNNYNNENVDLDKCKKALMKNPLIPLISLKDIFIDSINVLPWFILLIIISIIIII